jgi:hypothetical protein
MIKVASGLPDSVRHRLSRTAHFDTAFTHVDAEARAAYHRRLDI